MLLLACLSLFVTACFHVPIGDRKDCLADKQFAGVWVRSVEGNGNYEVWRLAPFDDGTYCIVGTSYKGMDGIDRNTAYDPLEYQVVRGWVNRVDKYLFLSMTSINGLIPNVSANNVPQYSIAQIQAMPDGTLIVNQLDEAHPALRECTNTADLAKRVVANINDPKIFSYSRTLHRCNKEDRNEAIILSSFAIGAR